MVKWSLGKEELANRVKAARALHGWSAGTLAEEVARDAGAEKPPVGIKQIREYEQKRRDPEEDELRAIAIACQVPMTWFTDSLAQVLGLVPSDLPVVHGAPDDLMDDVPKPEAGAMGDILELVIKAIRVADQWDWRIEFGGQLGPLNLHTGSRAARTAIKSPQVEAAEAAEAVAPPGDVVTPSETKRASGENRG